MIDFGSKIYQLDPEYGTHSPTCASCIVWYAKSMTQWMKNMDHVQLLPGYTLANFLADPETKITLRQLRRDPSGLYLTSRHYSMHITNRNFPAFTAHFKGTIPIEIDTDIASVFHYLASHCHKTRRQVGPLTDITSTMADVLARFNKGDVLTAIGETFAAAIASASAATKAAITSQFAHAPTAAPVIQRVVEEKTIEVEKPISSIDTMTMIEELARRSREALGENWLDHYIEAKNGTSKTAATKKIA